MGSNKKSISKEDKIKNLISKGYGRGRIAAALGVRECEARKMIDEVKSQTSAVAIEDKPKAKKKTVAEQYRDLLDEEFDSYDIAKLKRVTPNTVIRTIEKIKNPKSPVEKMILKAACRGVLLSELEETVGVKGLKRAKEVLMDVFEHCFILEHLTGKDKKDIFLIPMYKSAREVEELKTEGVPPKDFEYSVSLTEDYMYVKFAETLPFNEIEIYSVGDLHIGAGQCREDLIDWIIEFILAKPNRYVLCTGDIIDQITKYSVGDAQEMCMSNTKQILTAAKKLKKIAHRILDYVYSNHDDGRTEKTSQTRSGEVIANIIGVPYFKPQALIQVEFKGVIKTILHAHQFGQTYTEDKILTEAKRIKSTKDYPIDCFVSGHCHKAVARMESVDSLVLGRGEVTKEYCVAVNGSTTARKLSYGATYPPSKQDIVWYGFDSNGKDYVSSIKVSVI